MPDTEPTTAPPGPADPAALDLLKKLAIWGAFLAVVYLFRNFFFTAFMTFLFCYMALAVVDWGMRRLSPGKERPALRRLLAVGVFLLTPLALLGIGLLVGPRLVEQGQRLAGWLNSVTPESEAARVLEKYVGPYLFRQQFGGPGDPRYQKGLDEFKATGDRHVKAYLDFPHVETWVAGGFGKQFDDAERGRIQNRLAHEGTSSREFEEWFLKDKVPELQALAKKQVPDAGRSAVPIDPLVKAAATAPPDQLLQQARRDPAALAVLQPQWVQDTVERGLAAAKQSPAYLTQLRTYYDQRKAESPGVVSYTFDQYVELRNIRPKGPKAFGDALEKIDPTPAGQGESRERADFEAAKSHELFMNWWGSSSVAGFLRHHLGSEAMGADRVEKTVVSLLNVPLDVGTALLLSLFICIDFPKVKRGTQALRGTWLRGVYDEVAPAMHSLGQLIGRAFHAQGLIALGNAVMMYIALNIIGVEHPVLLAFAVFVLCLVPTLGTAIAGILIAAVALIQPDGGLALALKALIAVAVVILIETFVTSPIILGRMMELHPVMTLSVLPLAQYFFGVWGLILATPVAVYVIHEVILRRGLPGITPTSDGKNVTT